MITNFKLYEQLLDYDIIIDIIVNYVYNNKLDDSFSGGKYYRSNVKKDIADFKEYLKERGIDCDEFFKLYKKKIFSDKFFIGTCGFLDALLYSYDKSNPIGGGYELISLENESSECEHIIKYNYNYHEYELGKNYILQSYKTLENFFFGCAEWYWKELFQSDNSVIYENEWIRKFDFEKNHKLFMMSIKLSNGAISFINLNHMYDLVCNKNVNYDTFTNLFLTYAKASVYNISEGWCAKYFGTIDEKFIEDLVISKIEKLDPEKKNNIIYENKKI